VHYGQPVGSDQHPRKHRERRDYGFDAPVRQYLLDMSIAERGLATAPH
jgi:hypothetical protein